MSYVEYKESMTIEQGRYGFYSLIMAAMRQADSENIEKLKDAFPKQWTELRARYNAPDGCLTKNEFRIYSSVPKEIKEEYLESIKFPND